jgi:hypothetical protein
MNKSSRLVLAIIPLLLVVTAAPAGSERPGCGLPQIRDPEIRASFERFDRQQSEGAHLVCGLYATQFDIVSPPR